MGALPACRSRLENIPLGSVSSGPGSLHLKRAGREDRIYSLAITRASAALGRTAGVTGDSGQHAMAKVSPSERLTTRRGDFAIMGWRVGKIL